MSVFKCLICTCLLLTLCSCGLFVSRIPQGVLPDKGPHDKMIDVNGLTYHYVEYPGQKENILLLHGFSASTYTWNEMAAMLSYEGYHVWALDLKGYGWSDKPTGDPYDMVSLSESVIDWMDAVHLMEAVVVGNSMGGGITAILSKNHPERVSSMVLIDAVGYPMPMPVSFRFVKLPGASFLGNLYLSKGMIRRSLKEVFYNDSLVTDDKVDAYFKPMRVKGAVTVQVKTSRAFDFEHQSAVQRATKNNPTRSLIIWGENDEWVPLLTVAHRFRRDLKNSILHVIPQCGHVPQEEKPRQVANLVLDFINNWKIEDHGESL